MFYRMNCGCIVLPISKDEHGWKVLDIDRCDQSHDENWPHIGRQYIQAFDPTGQVGYRKIEDGAELTPEKEQELLDNFRSLVHDGYRYREIRSALSPERDIKRS
jgi:hypothetical protein